MRYSVFDTIDLSTDVIINYQRRFDHQTFSKLSSSTFEEVYNLFGRKLNYLRSNQNFSFLLGYKITETYERSF